MPYQLSHLALVFQFPVCMVWSIIISPIMIHLLPCQLSLGSDRLTPAIGEGRGVILMWGEDYLKGGGGDKWQSERFEFLRQIASLVEHLTRDSGGPGSTLCLHGPLLFLHSHYIWCHASPCNWQVQSCHMGSLIKEGRNVSIRRFEYHWVSYDILNPTIYYVYVLYNIYIYIVVWQRHI